MDVAADGDVLLNSTARRKGPKSWSWWQVRSFRLWKEQVNTVLFFPLFLPYGTLYVPTGRGIYWETSPLFWVAI